MDILQIVISLALLMILLVPTGKYLYKVVTGERSFVDPVLDRIDNFIYRITGVKKEDMNWKQYAWALVAINLVMCLLVFALFLVQGVLGLNPNHNKSMELSLAFNTAVSFITNTNLQHYSGEWGLTHLTQMAAITFLMFTSAATGFAVAVAIIRGIIGKTKSVGNFYVDLVRIITRVFLPLSIVVTLLLVWQGVPQTLAGNQTVTTIEGTFQKIALGPIASLESIKHLGTNGGGFLGANSAHPFENPTALSNLFELLSMMLIPSALVYTFGLMLKNKKQAWILFISMAFILLVNLAGCYLAESAGNPVLADSGLNQSMGNMEGKEVRFGIAQSSLFTTVTTAYTTGTVNNMHDSLTPLGGLVPMFLMMLNVVFGGKGVGFVNLLMFAILTVFLSGLMVGRTPEFLGKKVEGKEVKLIAISILTHPFIILIPVALSLVIQPGLAGVTNPGFHGLSQILYEFTSAAANNGSGFEGLADNTVFWNLSTGIVMLIGRYVSMILMLAVAGSLLSKKEVPVSVGTFRTDNALFGFILVAIIIIVGALTFFPALALAPIAEHLTLGL